MTELLKICQITLVLVGHYCCFIECSGVQVFSNGYFGQGIGSIAYDNVACTGREFRLVDCQKRTASCRHSQDSGVRCQQLTGKIYNLLVSERSERDTIRDNSIENRGYLFIYMFGRTHVIFVLDHGIFCVSSVVDPVPNFTKRNLLVYRSLPLSS